MIFRVFLCFLGSLLLTSCSTSVARPIECNRELTNKLYPSINGLLLEQYGINKYFEIFGKAPIYVYKTDIGRANVVCYLMKNEILALYENPNTKKVVGATLANNMEAIEYEIRPYCTKITKSVNSIKIGPGLYIGMRKSSVENILGKPIRDEKILKLYEYYKIKKNPDVYKFYCVFDNKKFESFDYILEYDNKLVATISINTEFYE
jgi:hypothetical protein